MKPSNYLFSALFVAAALVGNVAQASDYHYRVFAEGLRAPPVLAPAEEALGVLSADTTADFGVVPLNTTASRKFTFYNSGNLDATGVYAAITATSGLSLSSTSCGTAASPVTVAAGASCQVTVSYGGNTSSQLAGADVRVVGGFTGSPAAVPLSGSVGAFNVVANWSTSYSSTAPLTAANLTFGTVTRDTVVDREFFLRNVGTSGSLSAGFQLSGDSSQFKIVGIYRRSTGGGYGCLAGGGVIAPGGQSTTTCLSDANAPNVFVTLRYAPTVIGNHSITITPTTNNGSTLPEPITITGSGQFNPTAAWSTWSSGYAAMTTAYANYNTVTVGASADKRITLANVGTNGAEKVGVVLTGDTAHFTVVGVARYMPGTTYGCVGGGVIAADKLSTTPCGADTGAPHVFFDIRYTPKSKGNHTLTLTAITDNGTALPAPLVLSGTGG